jgi:hypothetical protein
LNYYSNSNGLLIIFLVLDVEEVVLFKETVEFAPAIGMELPFIAALKYPFGF